MSNPHRAKRRRVVLRKTFIDGKLYDKETFIDKAKRSNLRPTEAEANQLWENATEEGQRSIPTVAPPQATQEINTEGFRDDGNTYIVKDYNEFMQTYPELGQQKWTDAKDMPPAKHPIPMCKVPNDIMAADTIIFNLAKYDQANGRHLENIEMLHKKIPAGLLQTINHEKSIYVKVKRGFYYVADNVNGNDTATMTAVTNGVNIDAYVQQPADPDDMNQCTYGFHYLQAKESVEIKNSTVKAMLDHVFVTELLKCTESL